MMSPSRSRSSGADRARRGSWGRIRRPGRLFTCTERICPSQEFTVWHAPRCWSSSPPHLRPAGPLVADQPTIELQVAALGLTFPVYPEGAVTLRLPVILTSKDSATAVLSVTYMACSDRVCLAPVIDKRIAVRIPALAASAP